MKKNFVKSMILIFATLMILLIFSPSCSGEEEFRFSNVYYEPENPEAQYDIEVFIEITSSANISDVDGEWEFETKGVSGYGPATIIHGAPMVFINRTENIWRYKTGNTIDKDDISPLKLKINATDANGKEIKKELTISFKGGYKPSSGNGSPGFEILFLMIAIMIVIIRFNRSKKTLNNK